MPSPITAYLCYDPRDPTQCLEDRATWKHSANGILIAATMLYASRDNCPVDWEKVALLADLGEEPETRGMAPPVPRLLTLGETNAMLRMTLDHDRVRPYQPDA